VIVFCSITLTLSGDKLYGEPDHDVYRLFGYTRTTKGEQFLSKHLPEVLKGTKEEITNKLETLSRQAKDDGIVFDICAQTLMVH